LYHNQKQNIMTNTWIYVDFNYDTEMWEVKKQVRGVSEDEILKSYKSEVWAHNYKAQINY